MSFNRKYHNSLKYMYMVSDKETKKNIKKFIKNLPLKLLIYIETGYDFNYIENITTDDGVIYNISISDDSFSINKTSNSYLSIDSVLVLYSFDKVIDNSNIDSLNKFGSFVYHSNDSSALYYNDYLYEKNNYCDLLINNLVISKRGESINNVNSMVLNLNKNLYKKRALTRF